jgi:hypothetical protein
LAANEETNQDLMDEYLDYTDDKGINLTLLPRLAELSSLLQEEHHLDTTIAPVVAHEAEARRRHGEFNTAAFWSLGDLSIMDNRRLMTWLRDHIPEWSWGRERIYLSSEPESPTTLAGGSQSTTQKKLPIPSWCREICLAHARTLLIAHRCQEEFSQLPDYPVAQGKQQSSEEFRRAEHIFLIAQAWKRMVGDDEKRDENRYRRDPVDVEKAAIEELEEAMFTQSKEARRSGDRQWGKDTSGHQDGWDPYSETPEDWDIKKRERRARK